MPRQQVINLRLATEIGVMERTKLLQPSMVLSTSVQAIIVPADDLTDPAPPSATTFFAS